MTSMKEAVISGMMAGAIFGAFVLPDMLIFFAILGAGGAAFACSKGLM